MISGVFKHDDEQGPVSSVPSDYVKCPHCERHFGPKAADRHISWCREQSTRVPRSPADNQAVERLKSRTKVRLLVLTGSSD
ncbi:Zinc finger C2HC domain-containing protein [Portunus trituberculatus]|uniref:Zinc finger C2HC domain-containing protein n=1 Tax=Portunus trituberculatus TaxID=210409 RepID=A0A5B7H153_PORTR|nr:Zinc finger C2HC domain-containing protein [Portunus trituberculatus]